MAPAGEEDEFAVGMPAQAEGERLAPVVEGECAGDRHGEPTLGSVLREVAKHVVAQFAFEAVVHLQFIGGGTVIADSEDTTPVAARDLDEGRATRR